MEILFRTFAGRAEGRYSAVAQAIHWATAIVVLLAFIYGLGGSEVRIYDPARDFERQIHETLGLTVFVLVIARMLWRMVDTHQGPAPVSLWMGWVAIAVQMALYVLLFAIPLTAIAGAWLEGHPLTLLGGLQVASPLTTSHDIGATLANIHGWLGNVILWVAGLHALAALFHHFVLKDGVLISMLPRWISGGRS